MTQLSLLLGRPLALPADADATYTIDQVEIRAVTVWLSPRQAEWMGVEEAENPGCPGRLIFGCCALHDDAAS